MRILLDTNIVLDVILKRDPFFRDSYALWQLADAGIFDASLASFSLPTIHYICRRQRGRDVADAAIDACLEAFEICPLYGESIFAARQIGNNDFEDNLQAACGLADFVEGLVTRNARDFLNVPLRIYTPTELLEVLRR